MCCASMKRASRSYGSRRFGSKAHLRLFPQSLFWLQEAALRIIVYIILNGPAAIFLANQVQLNPAGNVAVGKADPFVGEIAAGDDVELDDRRTGLSQTIDISGKDPRYTAFGELVVR